MQTPSCETAPALYVLDDPVERGHAGDQRQHEGEPSIAAKRAVGPEIEAPDEVLPPPAPQPVGARLVGDGRVEQPDEKGAQCADEHSCDHGNSPLRGCCGSSAFDDDCL